MRIKYFSFNDCKFFLVGIFVHPIALLLLLMSLETIQKEIDEIKKDINPVCRELQRLEDEQRILYQKINALQKEASFIEKKKMHHQEFLKEPEKKLQKLDQQKWDLEAEKYYSEKIGSAEKTKPGDLEHLTTDRLRMIYKEIFKREPEVYEIRTMTEIPHVTIRPGDSHYRELLIEKFFPKCEKCDTILHDKYRHRICSTCKEEGHDPWGCPHRICATCKQEGHDAHVCPTITCEYCKEKGHIKRYCSKFVCQLCNKQGHVAMECKQYSNKYRYMSRQN